MTDRHDLAAFFADYAADLPAGCTPITEPFGWRCDLCGSTMTLPDRLPETDTKRRSVAAMMIDAATHHQRTGCS